jgi:hypothetical protein
MKRSHERGQVLPLIGLALATTMGFGGVAVDVGYWEFQQQAQQSATDAAAIGGAQQLVHSNCTGGANAKAAALADAASNGFPNGGNIVVSANSPPTSGPFSGNACAVSVSITANHVSSFFAKLFGAPNGVTESTQGVATVAASNYGACIYLLSPTVETNMNGANIQGPGCAIDINDTINFNGATVKSPYIGYAGPAPNINGSTFQLATPAPMLPIADPCPGIAGCSYVANNPPSQSNCTSFNGNGWTGTLSPGCYSNLNLNGANVTFSPGTYVLSSSSNFNGATLNGSGVTFYVPAGASAPNFNCDSGAHLSPPSSGNLAGVLYYQVPSNTNSPNFNGTQNSYSGLIYAPGATSANFNGSAGNYVVLVFGAANYNGSVAWDFATPAPGQALVKQAVLSQ